MERRNLFYPGFTCNSSGLPGGEMAFFFGDIPSKEKTQQPVKSYEMIHIRMADKNMADFENISGRKRIDVPQIENYGTFFKKKGDE
jgi:hypothetical protein